jgi:hypothetical protein
MTVARQNAQNIDTLDKKLAKSGSSAPCALTKVMITKMESKYAMNEKADAGQCFYGQIVLTSN